PFFEALARYLAQNLGMDYVCIDRLEGDELTARTVAVWCDGHFEDNVTYALKDTPCGDVVGQTVCCFPTGVCQLFPRDPALQDLKAESYVGVTLFDHTGRPIGLIAVIGRKPLANRPLVEAILKMVAARAAGEVERLVAEEALRESEGKYRNIFQNAAIGIFQSLPEGRFLRVNPELAQMMGYVSPEEMISAITDISAQTCVDSKKRSDIIAAAMENSGWVLAENRYRRKDGTIMIADLTLRKVLHPDGTVAYFEGFVTDITRRKQAEEALEEERRQLQQALNEVRTLRGIVPICSYCKKIRDDEGYWNHVEKYVSAHTDAKFSHGICPACFEREMKGIKEET
ncbi:MAG: PAS domain S-box protein, partial [Syntrophales bacterium]